MSKNNIRYRAVSPIRREGSEKTFWHRVGTGFRNDPKSGEGEASITVKLDSMPTNGELVLFPDDGKDKEAAA